MVLIHKIVEYVILVRTLGVRETLFCMSGIIFNTGSTSDPELAQKHKLNNWMEVVKENLLVST